MDGDKYDIANPKEWHHNADVVATRLAPHRMLVLANPCFSILRPPCSLEVACCLYTTVSPFVNAFGIPLSEILIHGNISLRTIYNRTVLLAVSKEDSLTTIS